MNNTEIYERVTSTILEALDRGVVPWDRPWRTQEGASGLHQNFITRKAYRGVNQFICEIAAASSGYSSPYWLSFKQAKQKGGKVRKDEKGTLITYWKILRKKSDKRNERNEPVYETIPLLKFYYVFNLDQIDGIEAPVVEQPEEKQFDPIEAAEQIAEGMPNQPRTMHCGDRAFYSPLADTITLPPREAFDAPPEYYSTRFHEDVHATGHEERLGRVKDWTQFGSDPYAKEELVAELGAAMLCGTAGIHTTQERSASYIANWSQRFQQDKKLIISAASQAQKAADYILGVEYTNGEPAEREMAHA